MKALFFCIMILCSTSFVSFQVAAEDIISRPLQLIKQMKPSALKEKLLSCRGQPNTKTSFSIGHRGAPLQYPEHTVESYIAAANMGAGILECDVTFTKDKVLVCRHSQSDLHETTDILASSLSNTCAVPFQAGLNGENANVQCHTSDITLAEFRSLKGKMGKVNKKAQTIKEYLAENNGAGQVITHSESIELFKSLNVKFIPELKRPVVDMPYDGFSQEDYAQKLVDEYKAADVPAEDVYLQSFSIQDILYWLKNEPEFAKQAVYLDGRFRKDSFDISNPDTFEPSMGELKKEGLNFIAPPLWMLVQSKEGEIIPSPYANEAKKAGLKIIAWTVERSGSLENGGGWYYQTISDLIDNDGQVFELLDVLAQDVGVVAVFSDWPETTTYYANCMKL
ncbi:glycerophosphodiester phosphodiesterase family protein [Curvivirga aplysinae]|uniref:glycerophosphodiester phosphodiesterase family protein n=1 Tax=Curvivirga aplysinae TaxID=2529852 RepID=UPI0012BD054B|nr:glycerophosphodiester phosphodiesterase family protein [Curvivirga aplysinae]MTI10867.1 glycerophosphodiester phosphodiesterase [Curvivirga aplysinae]